MWIPAELAKPPKTFLKTHGGIYRIRNTQNNFVYIGQARQFKERYESHLYTMRRNKGVNRLLQADWNQYGESAFVFELAHCFPANAIGNGRAISYKQLSELEIQEYANCEGRRYNIYQPRVPSTGWQAK